MAFIPALNTIRVTLELNSNGQIVVNVIYLRKGTPVLAIDLVNIAAQLKSWFTTYMKPHLGNSIALQRIILRDMTTESGIVLESIASPFIVGALAEEPLPNNCALVTTFKTGIAGRSTRGRVYNAGFTENQIGGDSLTSVPVVGMVTAWTQLNSFVAPSSVVHVVASFHSLGAPRVGALTTPVTSYFSNSRLDTQRRRLPA